jgi:MoaA/NifB/PqqE/SkfB family radical SAM enzyme
MLAQRTDLSALSRIVDGADVVIDLLAFCESDAELLLRAIAAAGSPPKQLIFASTVAEQGRADFGSAEASNWEPDDDYGRGKRAARQRFERDFPGVVHSLILPRLVAEVDWGRREYPYIEAAAEGVVLLGSDLNTSQVVAPVDGVAAVIRLLCEDPNAVAPGLLNVGPPQAMTVGDAVNALLAGARLRAELRRHPDRQWRGPHGGGPELLDTDRLQQCFPFLEWPDPGAVYRNLGAWLLNNPPSSRPRNLVKERHKKFKGHGVVDVHGRREHPEVADPVHGLMAVADWLSPAFYVDIGRPCNSACMYCAVPPHLDTQGFAPLEKLKQQIEVGVAAGCERAIVIGGEPTIYPQIRELFESLSDAGLSGHVVMSNGLRLADSGLLDDLCERGLGTVHLSIDTADEAVYEQISRTGGNAKKQWQAFDNILQRSQLNLYIYVAVTQFNAQGVSDLLRAIAERAQSLRATLPVILAFVKPVGDALTHADSILLPPEQRVHLARQAVLVAGELGLTLGLRHLTACLAPELTRYFVDYYVEDYSVDLATMERRNYAHSEQYQHFVDECVQCAHRPYCSGIYKEEQARFGVAYVQALDGSKLRNSP